MKSKASILYNEVSVASSFRNRENSMND